MKDREERANAIMADIERAYAQHHKDCYNREAFKWEWCEIEHPGIWALGGYDRNVAPEFKDAQWCVPAPEKVPGWYCYIGPMPEFADGI
jgi:hypothetical protein